MSRLGSYYARVSNVRGDLSGLPPWARAVFITVTLPGVVLVALSIVLFVVSLFVLLLIAVPAYMVLRTAARGGGEVASAWIEEADPNRQTKKVDVIVHNVHSPGDLQAPDEVDGE